MATCSKCNKTNEQGANFCRFCGARFVAEQNYAVPQMEPFDHSAPKPYSWKTDEFATQSEARQTSATLGTSPIFNQYPQQQNQAVAYRPVAMVGQNYRCPACMSTYLPRLEKKISTGGWITFALLLVFFFPLFWIGLLMKEEMQVCPTCNNRVG